MKPHQLLTMHSSSVPWDETRLEGAKLESPAIDSALDRFSSLSLGELGNAALLDRKETKYVFTETRLEALFNGLESEYDILEIQGTRSFGYRSVYLDTPDRVFYYQHQAGVRPRWKIRLRTYLNTGMTFLEVKRKDNRNITQKTRLQIKQPIDRLTESIRLLEETNFSGTITDIKPVLQTYYTRITFVHKNRAERVTLDRQLRFSDGIRSQTFPKVVVAEIKHHRYNPCSPFLTQIKGSGVQPTRFSKYCLGSLLFDPTLKYNRFKPIFHHISPLTGGGRRHDWPL